MPVPIFEVSRRSPLIWSGVLFLLVLACLHRVVFLPFLSYDDPDYVTAEPLVYLGLRTATAEWALTTQHASNWHPLTTMTHAIMCGAFGFDTRAHHALNLLLHAGSAALLFGIIYRLTKSIGAAAAAAGLWAVHPLRVESVAWVAELKDVLCGFFWLLSAFIHLRPKARPSKWVRLWVFHWATIVTGVLAMLCKPMAVTLPLTLLILDELGHRRLTGGDWRQALIEKIPLFAAALGLAIVTFVTQSGAGATEYGESLNLLQRLGNAAVSVVRYVGKTILPLELSIFYPHPGWWPWWAVAGASALIGSGLFFSWRMRERAPWLLGGLAWFLITLLPVCGIIQVGAQSMADRYTYISTVGGYIVLGFALTRWNGAKIWAACGMVAALGIAGFNLELRWWKNTETLMQRCTDLHPASASAWHLRATVLGFSGKQEETEAACREALKLEPGMILATTTLCPILQRTDRAQEAMKLIEAALAKWPHSLALRSNRAVLLADFGQIEEAEKAMEKLIIEAPYHMHLRFSAASIQATKGNYPGAIRHQAQGLAIYPWLADAYIKLAEYHVRFREAEPARVALRRALYVDPKHELAAKLLATLMPPPGK